MRYLFPHKAKAFSETFAKTNGQIGFLPPPSPGASPLSQRQSWPWGQCRPVAQPQASEKPLWPTSSEIVTVFVGAGGSDTTKRPGPCALKPLLDLRHEFVPVRRDTKGQVSAAVLHKVSCGRGHHCPLRVALGMHLAINGVSHHPSQGCGSGQSPQGAWEVLRGPSHPHGLYDHADEQNHSIGPLPTKKRTQYKAMLENFKYRIETKSVRHHNL